MKVLGKSIGAGDRWDVECLLNATHFSVHDCACPELAPHPLPDLQHAISAMQQALAEKKRWLVYGYHFRPNIEICFQQVLLTPRVLAVAQLLVTGEPPERVH